MALCGLQDVGSIISIPFLLLPSIPVHFVFPSLPSFPPAQSRSIRVPSLSFLLLNLIPFVFPSLPFHPSILFHSCSHPSLLFLLSPPSLPQFPSSPRPQVLSSLTSRPTCKCWRTSWPRSNCATALISAILSAPRSVGVTSRGQPLRSSLSFLTSRSALSSMALPSVTSSQSVGVANI